MREAPARAADVRVGSATDGLTPFSVAERSLSAALSDWFALAAVAIAAVAADQVTKHIVSSQLALDDQVKLVGPFSIHHVQNSGIAFGLFASATAFVIALTALAVGWMLVFFARSGARHPTLPAALGLVIGGSLSNLVDRVRLGHVTDFLDFNYWPAFNLADTFIVVGVGIFACLALIDADTSPRRLAPLPFRVPDDAAESRLDAFVATHVGSRALAERVIESGVLVDGVAREKSWRLQGGEDVEFEPPAQSQPPQREELELTVAYEDEHLLVIDKPAGLVVHPAPGHTTGTLVHGLVGVAGGGEEARPGIVHRLDRDTSGLLVVAKTEQAYARLQALVRKQALDREYLALVRGRPRSLRGRIEAPIGRDRNDPSRRSLDTDSPRDAITHFEVAELLPHHALLRVRLETGRTHQIRVHLAAIELPVSGDPVYGVPGDLGLERQFLHAARLAFAHPVTGEPVEDDPRAAPRTSRPRSNACRCPSAHADPPGTLCAAGENSIVNYARWISPGGGAATPWAGSVLSPPAQFVNQPEEGGPWQSSPCESSWRPESTSATRRAAGTRR